MTTRQRWIRINVGWDDTDWIASLSAEARLAWIMLLCHVKRDGIAGRCKLISDRVAGRKWGVGPDAVREMIDAGRYDGAIFEADGEWVITAWSKYQVDNSTPRVQQYRAKQANDETV